MENNCQDCGCKDKFLPVAPCTDPAECPSPEKCEETFDAACVQYTGLDLKCGTATIVATNTTVEQALENIVDKICDLAGNGLVVEIAPFGEFQLRATVTSGIAPYTYKWSIQQGLFVGHIISGSDTAFNVTLIPVPANTLQVGGISGATGAVNMSHIRLDVTDASLAKTTRYYTFANLV